MGTCTMHFNRIVGNAPSDSAIFNGGMNMDASLNWWGSNNNPSSQVTGTVTFGPWLVLTITPGQNPVVGGKVPVTVDLQHDSDKVHHDPSEGHVPDGTSTTFSTDLGSLNPITVYLVNGNATTTFTANSVGLANINAVLDNQTVTTQLDITKASTTVVVKEVTTTVGKPVIITAILTDENGNLLSGKKVTFTINDKTYTATTDDYGVATLNYTPLNAGNYSITANFTGDADYINCNATSSLNVIKSNPINPVNPNYDSNGVHHGNSSTVHAANVVDMQKTGLPLNYLILAVLMVLSGLIVPKRK